jgi:uncharacterized protein (DUF305 family)
MTPHHAQALVWSTGPAAGNLDRQFEQLAEHILAAQAPDIEPMTDWLQDCDQPVPATSRDHVNADDGHAMGDTDDDGMPGMMSEAELSDLQGSHGTDFEDMWLRMMIEHHEGAVEMAQEEAADGKFPGGVAAATRSLGPASHRKQRRVRRRRAERATAARHRER